MAKSKLSYTKNTTSKLSVKGKLSNDGTSILYIDENEIEQIVKVSDLLNEFKDQSIEFAIQLKEQEELGFDTYVDDDVVNDM